MLRTVATITLLLGALPALAAAPLRGARSFVEDRARAEHAVSALRQIAPQLVVQWPAHRSQPAMIQGLDLLVPGKDDADRARRFLTRYPALFADGRSELRLIDVQQTNRRRVVRFQQIHAGVPVEGARVNVVLDAAGRVHATTSQAVPLRLATTTPRISANEAARQAYLGIAGKAPTAVGLDACRRATSLLVILAEGAPRLVHRIVLPLALDPQGRRHLVDARSGQYLGWRPGMIVDGPSQSSDLSGTREVRR